MKKKLKPFQLTGSRFMVEKIHALLGDEPGLGKTIQAIDGAEKVRARSVLVTCPASVRKNWEREINECWSAPWYCQWDVISYNGAVKEAQFGNLRRQYDVWIGDEGHFLKTLDSQRTQALFNTNFGLARRAHFKWPMTGTPVLNRPKELYPILKALNGHNLGRYNTYARFIQQFCNAHWVRGRGIDDRGASNLEELARILEPFMIRRTQEDVLPELPPAVITRMPIELDATDREFLHAIEDEIEDRETYISAAYERFSQMGDSSRLLRATGEAKVRPTVRFVEEQLLTVDKVLVLAKHRDVTGRLYSIFDSKGLKPAMHRGGMSDRAKAESEKRFVNDRECRVIVGNIQSIGTGVDGLQKVCNTAVFGELSWTPGDVTQCVRRLKRMGLMPGAKRVNAYILHALGTIESAVLGSHDGKIPVINKLLGDNSPRFNSGFEEFGAIDPILGDLI